MKPSLAWIAAATFGVVAATSSVAVASRTGVLGFSNPNRSVGQLTSSQVNAMMGEAAGGASTSSTVSSTVSVTAPTTTEQPVVIRYEDVYISVPPTSQLAATSNQATANSVLASVPLPASQTIADSAELDDTGDEAVTARSIPIETSSEYSDDYANDHGDDHGDDPDDDHGGKRSGRDSRTSEHISEGEDDDD